MKKIRLTTFALVLGAIASGLYADEAQKIAGRSIADYSALLKDENRSTRLRAVKSLGAFEEKAGPALLVAMKHEDAAVRYIAAVHLGRIGGDVLKSAVDPLTKLRSDKASLATQQAAAFALCRAGMLDENLPLLIERLTYPERAMACSAAELIGMIGPPAIAAAEALEQIKRDNPPSGKGDYHRGDAAGHALLKIKPDQP
jgi:HEAT repeat protein